MVNFRIWAAKGEVTEKALPVIWDIQVISPGLLWHISLGFAKTTSGGSVKKEMLSEECLASKKLKLFQQNLLITHVPIRHLEVIHWAGAACGLASA